MVPILLFANAGVLAAMVGTGLAVHWVLGFPILVGLVFGAIISATDPISVLALFRDMAVGKRLSTLVEGESLLNDGTAAVLYGILVGAVMTGKLNVVTGVGSFFVEVLGGAAVGLGLGYLVSICLSGCFSKPQAVVYGRAATSISENLARVPIDVR
jgi:CPA1 family monovalent cation:H+ antiporter